MQFSKRAARPLMFCSALIALSACEQKRIVTALPIPPERMDCAPAGTRPPIPPEYVIDWSKVHAAPSVAEAARIGGIEVGKYVGSVRTREGVVAGYVLSIEGQLFACSNNAQWLRDWQAGVAGS